MAKLTSTHNTCPYAGLSFVSYILAEVSHGYLLEEDEQMYSEKQRRVSTFMKTPRELEKVSLGIVLKEDHVPVCGVWYLQIYITLTA